MNSQTILFWPAQIQHWSWYQAKWQRDNSSHLYFGWGINFSGHLFWLHCSNFQQLWDTHVHTYKHTPHTCTQSRPLIILKVWKLCLWDELAVCPPPPPPPNTTRQNIGLWGNDHYKNTCWTQFSMQAKLYQILMSMYWQVSRWPSLPRIPWFYFFGRQSTQ
jgi:hypothetical protein